MTESPRDRAIRLHLDADAGAPFAADQIVALEPGQAHYLAAVMRARPGERLRVFNGTDGEWRAEIAALDKRGGTLRLQERLRPPETPPDLWLLFAPLKKTQTDFVVEKATELGCRRLRPVFTRRTNADRVNVARLSLLAREAAEQCERVFLPEIDAPIKLGAALDAWPAERRLYFCDETREAPPLAVSAERGPAAVLIGPEGGFTSEEAADLKRRAFVRPVALGPRILRADTAAAAALSVWQAVAGDWGGGDHGDGA